MKPIQLYYVNLSDICDPTYLEDILEQALSDITTDGNGLKLITIEDCRILLNTAVVENDDELVIAIYRLVEKLSELDESVYVNLEI